MSSGTLFIIVMPQEQQFVIQLKMQTINKVLLRVS